MHESVLVYLQHFFEKLLNTNIELLKTFFLNTQTHPEIYTCIFKQLVLQTK